MRPAPPPVRRRRGRSTFTAVPMRYFRRALRESFRRRLILPFPSSDHSSAEPLHAAAGALDRPLGNR